MREPRKTEGTDGSFIMGLDNLLAFTHTDRKGDFVVPVKRIAMQIGQWWLERPQKERDGRRDLTLLIEGWLSERWRELDPKIKPEA